MRSPTKEHLSFLKDWSWYVGITIYSIALMWGLADLFQQKSQSMDLSLRLIYKLVVVSVAFIILQIVSRRLFDSIARSVIRRKIKWSLAVYEAKVENFGSHFFKFVYHAAICVCFHIILTNETWMPPELLGNGSVQNAWSQIPVPQNVNTLYKVMIAYHVSELVFQVAVDRSRPDNREMLLHHITTAWLLLASYLTDLQYIGTLVLIVHYVPDVFVYLVKLFCDTSCKITTLVSFFCVLVSWLYCRLIVLPVVIIPSVWAQPDVWCVWFSGLLFLLVLMHIYWMCIFVSIGYHFIATGETQDKQSGLVALLEEDRGAKEAVGP